MATTTATFTAPSTALGTTLEFTAEADDGETVTSDTVLVTILPSGTTPNATSFEAPYTRNGTTLTFTATAEDGGSDTVSVTILPHNEWLVAGGTETTPIVSVRTVENGGEL